MLEESLNRRKKICNGVSIPDIMIGSFQVNDYNIMRSMVESAINCDCFGFDTSPSYGSEIILSKSINDVCKGFGISRDKVFISNKIDGWQMYKKNGEIEFYVDKSLKEMELEYFDLLLIHWPFEKYLANTWKSFEKIYKKGKVKSIGLCNANIRIFNKLLSDDIEIKPHVVQNEISPLRVCENEVDFFHKENVIVEAYSPLCRMIDSIRESKELIEISNKYNKTIPQIILRWHLDRGIIPIFTSKRPDRIQSNLNIFDFKLSNEDIKNINSLNKNYKIFPESYGCPGY